MKSDTLDFRAASASSAVTDWRNYDSIYTERYMWIPQENQEGYDAGSTMPYADRLQRDLMLFFGTADNNVHPSNTLLLIAALQEAGKHFQVQVGPDRGHAGLIRDRMMESFMESLVLGGGRVLVGKGNPSPGEGRRGAARRQYLLEACPRRRYL